MEQGEKSNFRDLKRLLAVSLVCQVTMLVWLACHYQSLRDVRPQDEMIRAMLYSDALHEVPSFKYSILPVWLLIITMDVVTMAATLKVKEKLLKALIWVKLFNQICSFSLGLLLSLMSSLKQFLIAGLIFTLCFTFLTACISAIIIKMSVALLVLDRLTRSKSYLGQILYEDMASDNQFSINSNYNRSSDLDASSMLRQIKIETMYRLYSNKRHQESNSLEKIQGASFGNTQMINSYNTNIRQRNLSFTCDSLFKANSRLTKGNQHMSIASDSLTDEKALFDKQHVSTASPQFQFDTSQYDMEDNDDLHQINREQEKDRQVGTYYNERTHLNEGLLSRAKGHGSHQFRTTKQNMAAGSFSKSPPYMIFI